jgi:hypothetical protein
MRKKRLPIIALFLVVWSLAPFPATADWINFSGAENAPNIAEIQINNDHVRVELEVFVNDLAIFKELIPDALVKDMEIKRPPLAERLKHFSSHGLQIIDHKGRHLQAQVQLAEPRFRKQRPSPFAGKLNPYTRKPIPGPPKDKRVLYFELLYPFDERPQTLTLIPPLDETTGMGKVALGFVTYHDQVIVNDFRYLSEPSTITLDWDDPWYSAFDNKALKRWQRGGVMSFIYVEPYEVRHEILARVKDLSAWMDLGLRGNEFIEADENQALKQKVGEFFLQQDQVLIDGKRLKPILDRTSFVKYTLTRTFFIDQPEQIPINSAVIGVIITYLTDGLPQQVTNEWSLWSDRIQQIPADAIDPAGPFPSYVTPDNPVLVWTNYLKNYEVPTVAAINLDASRTTMQIPVASIGFLLALVPLGFQIRSRRRDGRPVGRLLGLVVMLTACGIVSYPVMKIEAAKPAQLATQLTDKEAVTVLDSLLKNIYRAFDFREEQDVYDRLATSVSGDLLSDIYLQNRQSLVVSQAGGARARVKAVDILSVAVEPLEASALGLKFDARWTAMGTVGHWGHIHTRKNQYHANIHVEPVDGAWKITHLELLDEKRIDPYADQNAQPTPDSEKGAS